MDNDFKNSFYQKLKDVEIEDDLIDSLDNLIKYRKFNSENLIDLINGELDESN